MKIKVIYLCALLILFPLISFAEKKTVICESPQGTRVDYFTINNINLQNDTFIMGRDRVSGMKPKIVLDDNNKNVLFIIGDAIETKSQEKQGNMQVLAYNEDQISFTGMINGAPILATYYPKVSILIYSQQSIWPGPDYQGARAVIFYSKCALQDTSTTTSVSEPEKTT